MIHSAQVLLNGTTLYQDLTIPGILYSLRMISYGTGLGQLFEAPYINIMIYINIFSITILQDWDFICIPQMISLYTILSPIFRPQLIRSYDIKLSEKAVSASEFQILAYK